MVFNVIHGVDEKDASTVTTPFNFDRNIRLASLRIGYDENAPKELVDGLRTLGARPKQIGARPRLQDFGIGGGGLNIEYAAAFDFFVQRKAKELGIDLDSLAEPAAKPGGVSAAYGAMPADYTSSPMAPANWNPRFVNGRTVKAFDFLNNQRRRMLYVVKYNEFMKDLDMFVSNAPGWDVANNAQTGHPCVVVPYKFDVPAQGQPGPNNPQLDLRAQPICGIIIGALYNDDKLLSVAHRFQTHNDVVNKHPTL